MVYLLPGILMKRCHFQVLNLILSLNEGKLKIIQVTNKFLIFLVLLSFPLSSYTQELKYNVIKNGKIIGKMIVTRVKSDSLTQMKLHSQVKTNLLVKMHVNSLEESQFKNGMLIYSTISREINGVKQINRQIKWSGHAYQLYEDGQTATIQTTPIFNNIVQLYFEEPHNRKVVFSESQKKWVRITKISESKYKMTLPDGNHNEFFYRDGICTKVVVHNTFFNAIFLLTK